MTERHSRPTSEAPVAHTSRITFTRAIGGLLLALIVFLLWTGLPVGELVARQREFTFKLVTGAALWTFVAFQWVLSFSRVQGWHKTAKALFVPHQIIGALGPVFLYAHAARWGFGYLLGLSAVFLTNLALGLCQPRSPARSKRLMSVWLVVHIALSVVLVALAGFHTWQAFYYE